MDAATVGSFGEQVAVEYLLRSGYMVLDRNWRYYGADVRGELDIVARDGSTVVFCEVKTRRGARFGHPAEAVVPTKVKRIRALGVAWLRSSGLRPTQVRFDVISVWPQPAGGAHLDHLRQVF